MGGTCSTKGVNEKNIYTLLIAKLQTNIPLGRLVDNIKIALKEIVCEYVSWF
jgi:hypothetical protein